MNYSQLESRDWFKKFMERSYSYLETNFAPRYEEEVTFIGQTVMKK